MSLLGNFPQEDYDYGMTEHIQRVKEMAQQESKNKYDLMMNLEDYYSFEGNRKRENIQGSPKIIEEKKNEIVDVFGDRINKSNYNHMRNNNIPGEHGFWI